MLRRNLLRDSISNGKTLKLIDLCSNPGSAIDSSYNLKQVANFSMPHLLYLQNGIAENLQGSHEN